MRRSPASGLCVFAALVMLVALGCSNSPTAPAEVIQAPQQSVTGASFGARGHGVGTTPPHANAAGTYRGDLGCGLLDGEGKWFPAGFPEWPNVLPCTVEVATYSKNGNASITVRASGVPNPTGRAVRWGPYNPGPDWAASYPELPGPPYPCMVAGPSRDFVNDILFTTNWHVIVTPSGEATLTCVYSKKWEFQWPE